MNEAHKIRLNIICAYAGCEMWVTRYTPRKFKVTEMIPEIIDDINDYEGENLDKYKLILRPLSDITQAEEAEWNKISTPVGRGMGVDFALNIHWTKRINYYRSIGIDCDGLIENGYAI
jgi:hypothetical protein